MIDPHEAIAEAIRLEYDDKENRLLIVFEIKSEKYRKYFLEHWSSDIDYVLNGKNLHIKDK